MWQVADFASTLRSFSKVQPLAIRGQQVFPWKKKDRVKVISFSDAFSNNLIWGRKKRESEFLVLAVFSQTVCLHFQTGCVC